MSCQNRNVALIVFLVLGIPLAVLAQDSSMKIGGTNSHSRLEIKPSEVKFHDFINQASETYKRLINRTPQSVPKNVLNDSHCIVIFPKVLTGALLVGTDRGEGLASCKGRNKKWSQPVVVSLRSGSIGLQVGAEVSEIVLFYLREDARARLIFGDLSVGASLSATAGEFGDNVETGSEGVAAYSQSNGVFAGVSINGSHILKNQHETNEFYGKSVDVAAMLDGRSTAEDTNLAAALTSLFP